MTTSLMHDDIILDMLSSVKPPSRSLKYDIAFVGRERPSHKACAFADLDPSASPPEKARQPRI